MIEVKMADPIPHELTEYNRLISALKSKYPAAAVHVERGAGDYALSGTTIWDDDLPKGSTHWAIYPSVPNRGIAQIKSDIISLVFAMRQIGFDIKFLDSDLPVRESVLVTKGKLESCVSLNQIVRLLEDANHEKLTEVKSFIEGKRRQGGRPSKRAVIEMIFLQGKSVDVLKPVRTGAEWARVKSMWKDKFIESKYSKMYKSLDEFCTFAPKEQVE